MRWIAYAVLIAAVTAPQLCFAEVLDRFLGKDLWEKVNGRTIYQVAKVRQGMDKLLGKKRARLVRASFGGGLPIDELEDPQLGRLIFVFTCQPHNCPEQATLYLRPDGEVIAACISEWTERQGRTTEWIGQDWGTTSKEEDCSPGGCGCLPMDDDLGYNPRARLNAAKARSQKGQ